VDYAKPGRGKKCGYMKDFNIDPLELIIDHPTEDEVMSKQEAKSVTPTFQWSDIEFYFLEQISGVSICRSFADWRNEVSNMDKTSEICVILTQDYVSDATSFQKVHPYFKISFEVESAVRTYDHVYIAEYRSVNYLKNAVGYCSPEVVNDGQCILRTIYDHTGGGHG
jgi:hypothetical protein